MTTTGDAELELAVKDFGPIGDAKIALRPLTVFVGPSNTGKSYLAILIYALHRVFSPGLYWHHIFGSRYGVEENFSKKYIKMFRDFMQKIYEHEGQSDVALPESVAGILSDVLDGFLSGAEREIKRCFGVSNIANLVRKGKSKAAQVTVRCKTNDKNPVEFIIKLGQKTATQTSIPAGISIPVKLSQRDRDLLRHLLRHLDTLFLFERRLDQEPGKDDQDSFGERVLFARSMRFDKILWKSLLGTLDAPARYLPADRTGIMHAHSFVVSSLISSASTAGIRPAARTPLLSGVLADFLEELISIAKAQGEDPSEDAKAKDDFGEPLERAILDGQVRVDHSPDIGYPNFAYRPHGWNNDLALTNASSMVSELAPVVLYLRHVIRPGHVLIIEEPESHLHPAMQVALTRQLAALVNAGFRIIVTTHSEWLLEELANIVNRSKLPPDATGEKQSLKPDQVGVWFFKPQKKSRKSVVKEVKPDESGLFKTDFQEVLNALHNDWADIASRSEESA